MENEALSNERVKLGRVAAVDVARGFALVGMGVYHLTWDLAHFGFVAPSVPFAPAMRLLSHGVASSFLALAGVSLVLAHPHGLRRAALAAGALALGAPLVLASERFNAPALVWLGLGTIAPPTLDWRPLTPWAGAVFLGLALARIGLPRLARSPLALWRPRAIVGRALGFAGRHSLAIYLAHQPILFAVLFALAGLTGMTARQERESYLTACRPACVENGGELDACAKACACVADRAQAAGVSLNAAGAGGGEDARRRLKSIVEACGSEAQ